MSCIGGLLAPTAYGVVVWAMTLNQLAVVSALRETSVIFAAIIGSLLLGERFGRTRVFAAALVAAGVIALNIYR